MKKICIYLLLIISIFNIYCFNKEEKEIEWKLEDGYIPDESTAKKVAEVIWIRIYGEDILDEKPFKVKLVNKETWIIEGTLKDGLDGGVAYMAIQKKDGKILSVIHTK